MSRVEIVTEIKPDTPCSIELPKKDRSVLIAAIFAKENYLITGDMIHFGKYYGWVEW